MRERGLSVNGESKYLYRAIDSDGQTIDFLLTKLRIITSQNFRKFGRAGRTIAGYESINMIRKGQIKNVERDDVLGQIRFIHSLFGIAV